MISLSFTNSKLVLKCLSGVSETSVKEKDRAKGIIPGYEVKNSLTDILAAKGKVLGFARLLIRQIITNRV